MGKVFLVSLCLVLAVAEPPSSYFPAQSRNSLSGQYGAPPPQRSQGFGSRGGSGSQGFGGRSGSGSHSYNSIAENQFGGSSRSSSRASSRYPSADFDNFAAPRFGQTQNKNQAPRGFGPARQQSGFNPRSSTFNPQPVGQYNAPSARFQPSSYSAATGQQQKPSTEYGAPFGRSNMDNDLAEPANYEYNYEVQAGDESGAEFGHQETREDDFAQGEYHVLLPDGRMQIVEYEADEEGFRPKIRYEETGYPGSRANEGPY